MGITRSRKERRLCNATLAMPCRWIASHIGFRSRAQMPALPAWMNEHRLLVVYLFLGWCLRRFFPLAQWIPTTGAFSSLDDCGCVWFCKPLCSNRRTYEMYFYSWGYGVTLYIVLCEVLL